MRWLAVSIVLALVCGARLARAGDTVGVVVTGDADLKVLVAKHLQRWLDHRGFKAVMMPMAEDAIEETATCLVAGDPRCARAVVEAHASTDNVVYARVDVAARTTDVTFNAYWFIRGHEAVAERRVCEHCASWNEVADRMMDALASGTLQMGRLDLRSKPSDLTVLLDNTEVGVTPVELDVTAGHHTLSLLRNGSAVAQREVDVTGGETTHITVTTPVVVNDEHPSRVVPLLLLGAGVGALATGFAFIYVGQQNGENQKYIYPDSTPVGIGLATVGVGVMIGSFVMLGQSHSSSPPTSTPIAAISSRGAYLGWQARF
jgi:hypothetical protein